ncbi:MAG: hypothetical protein AB9856_10760 [Cellulosilyticaceae bacterium]
MRLYNYLMRKLDEDEDMSVDFNEYLKETLDIWGEQYCDNLAEEDELDKNDLKRQFLSFVGKGNVEEFFEIMYEEKDPQVIKDITENEAEEFIKKALGIYDDLLDSFIAEVYYNANKTLEALKDQYSNGYYSEDDELLEEYEDEFEGYVIEPEYEEFNDK